MILDYDFGEYEVSDTEAMEAISKKLKKLSQIEIWLILEDYGIHITNMKNMKKDQLISEISSLASELDQQSQDDAKALFEYFEDDIKDYFYSNAKDSYEYNKDPMSYNGLKNSDFI